jgi:DMSO/TMAO reductase YedYZ molybdopterin-dependent catalytic subunit
MPKQTVQPNVRTGALVGGLLTAPLIAVFYLASQAVGLPFIPFDLLDWAARTLPGDVITFGIDLIVSIIAAFNLGETSSAAKTAEHIMAIGGFWLLGVVAGAVLFAILRSRGSQQRTLPGLLMGIVLAIPILFISASVNTTATASPFISALWIIGAFMVWGVALNRVYADLNDMAARSKVPASATSPEASDTQQPPLHVKEQEIRDGVERLDRRRFMIRLGGASAVITVIGAGLGALIAASGESEPSVQSLAWSDKNPLPNADAALEPAPGTRPEFTKVANHYRIDINALPPILHEEDWSLTINGMVDNPMVLTLDDLRNNYEPIDQFITLSCISNPVGGDLISTQRWTGVRLLDILREAGPTEGADYLYITCADGFYEYVARTMVVADQRIMLTYAWDDLPIPPEHGFPLRIYIPDLYGMKQPKWITGIELFPTDEQGYWVRRGWDEVARVRATSVIDTVAVDSVVTGNGGRLVPIGGIAFAGARGISKVEVRVDGGAWQEAQLREPISNLTWVIWRYDWPFQSGEHTFAVRCTDGRGMAQLEEYRDTRPSGATGIHTRRETL